MFVESSVGRWLVKVLDVCDAQMQNFDEPQTPLLISG
jgi:hypothetical protein